MHTSGNSRNPKKQMDRTIASSILWLCIHALKNTKEYLTFSTTINT
ncbi:hypothetical protein OIU84_024268 [Salix udensis]|uniref:Uncharacterized protein n=1 Tax=Salix udensis TaxID=889485 RepID=A0AAD6KIZ7_9ROSI|nr:hypothetical protein OIU84_024268 [Salix udensis]